MKLAFACVVLATGLAHAETSLEEYGKAPIRAASKVREAQCDIDVQLKGAVVAVEQRQRIVAPTGLAAAYNFDLPAGAVITGFAFKGDGAVEQALPISAHTTVEASTRPMLGTDPAMLVAKAEGASSDYTIYVQPFADDREVTLITRYSALAEVVGGALRFTLPPRTGTGLTVCRGTLRAASGPGASIARILVDTASTTARPAPFVIDAKPVVLEAQLAFAGRDPVVWTQSQPLSAGYSATVLTVAAPSLKTQTPLHRRAMIVVDTSRSMELVGRQNVGKVIRGVAAALPANIEIDAILYDRTAKRVFDSWKPSTAETTAAIEKAIAARPPTNGSDLEAALRLAHTAIADGRATSTLVVVVSDGVIGDTAGHDLTRALDGKTSTVDVLAVILDPARTSSPGATALRAPVSLYGGSFVEVASEDLDDALALVDEWLRPAWVELAIPGVDIPKTIRSGGGFVRTLLAARSPATFVLTGRSESAIKIAPRAGPAASIGALVLASTDGGDDAVAKVRERAVAKTPFVSPTTSFAVLTTTGKIAKDRTAMVRGGGPYERIVAVTDPEGVPRTKTASNVAPSAIAKITLERLFRDQLQPKAFACYQRALGTDAKLAGTVHFTLHLGRGEITQVRLAGLGNAGLDACLLDAAYMLSVPMPDFTVNADDQTIARYPLTFNLGKDAPIVVLGDADSSSPIDIDAIEGGVPIKGKPIHVDAKTPLGGMRPGN